MILGKLLNPFKSVSFLLNLGRIIPSFWKIFVKIKSDQTCNVYLSHNRFSINAFLFSHMKPWYVLSKRLWPKLCFRKMDVSGSLLKIREWMFKHKFHFIKNQT